MLKNGVSIWWCVLVFSVSIVCGYQRDTVDHLRDEVITTQQRAHERAELIAALQDQMLQMLPSSQKSKAAVQRITRFKQILPRFAQVSVSARLEESAWSQLTASASQHSANFRLLKQETNMAVAGLSSRSLRRVLRRLESQLHHVQGRSKQVIRAQLRVIRRNQNLLKPFRPLGHRTHRRKSINHKRRPKHSLHQKSLLPHNHKKYNNKTKRKKKSLSTKQKSTLHELKSIVKQGRALKVKRKLKVKKNVKRLLTGESEKRLRFISHKLKQELTKADKARRKAIGKELKIVNKQLLKFRKSNVHKASSKMKHLRAQRKSAVVALKAKKKSVAQMKHELAKVKRKAKNAMQQAQTTGSTSKQRKAFSLLKAAKVLKKTMKKEKKTLKKDKKMLKKDNKKLKKEKKVLKKRKKKVAHLKRSGKPPKKLHTFHGDIKKDLKSVSVKQLQKVKSSLKRRMSKSAHPRQVKALGSAMKRLKKKIQRKLAAGNPKGHHRAKGVINRTRKVLAGRSLSSLHALHMSVLHKLAAIPPNDVRHHDLKNQDETILSAIRRKRRANHSTNPKAASRQHKEQRKKAKILTKKAMKKMPTKTLKKTLSKMQVSAAKAVTRKQQRKFEVQLRALNRKIQRRRVQQKIMKAVTRKVKHEKFPKASTKKKHVSGDVVKDARITMSKINHEKTWFQKLSAVADKVNHAVNAERLRRARKKLNALARIDTALSGMTLPKSLPSTKVVATKRSHNNNKKKKHKSSSSKKKSSKKKTKQSKHGPKPGSSTADCGGKHCLPGGFDVNLSEPHVVANVAAPNSLQHAVTQMTKQSSGTFVKKGGSHAPITHITHLTHRDSRVVPIQTTTLTSNT